MSKPTGNPKVDALLEEYDARLRDEDTRHGAESKEWLRKMRPAIRLLAENDTERFEQVMTRALRGLMQGETGVALKLIRRILPTTKIDHLHGPWWLWECDIEMEDGSIRHGSIQGDGHMFATETLSIED